MMIILWIARITGSLVSSLWLFVVIAETIGERESLSWRLDEGMVMLGLVIASGLGVLIAWWREGIGGIIILICGLGHITFAGIVAGRNKVPVMLLTGGPLVVIGILFLIAWRIAAS